MITDLKSRCQQLRAIDWWEKTNKSENTTGIKEGFFNGSKDKRGRRFGSKKKFNILAQWQGNVYQNEWKKQKNLTWFELHDIIKKY